MQVVGATGAIQEAGAFFLSLVKAFFPFIEGFAGDS